MYLNLLFVHVTLSVTLAINQFDNTVDSPIAGADDQVSSNSYAEIEVREIKVYKDSDVRSNVLGFGEFLTKALQRKVLEYTLKPLTNLGDNFGSVMQVLEVKVIDSNDSNQVETLHLVCKTAGLIESDKRPLFTKETHFYSDIVPAIQHFEAIENIPQNERLRAFPRYFGSRFSLNSNATEVDSDSVLLLENLKSSNFVVKDRESRLDRKETLATLKDLAKMHALGISMRRKQPGIFNSKISPYLPSTPTNHSVFFSKVVDELHSVFKNYSAIDEQLSVAYFLKTDPDDHTPYTTISHRDLWIKNIMIKNDNTGADDAIQVKLLDFQRYRYESFANDLIYFLSLSAPLDDLKSNFSSFIEYYHLEFTKTLNHVDIPLDDYTYDQMWEEIKQVAKHHLIRILFQIKLQHTTYGGFISTGNPDLLEFIFTQPTSDVILTQWRCTIDLFIENKFI